MNQLFGKGKEPFWQQAYTNLVRWIIELHRVLPEQWVTLQQVYRCAIDPDLFAAKIKQAEAWSAELNTGEIFIPSESWKPKMYDLADWDMKSTPDGKEMQTVYTVGLAHKLEELGIKPRIVWEPGAGDNVRERVAAVKRWFDNDWQKLDKQNQILDCRGRFRIPVDVRYAGRGGGLLSPAPGSVRRSTAHWPEGQGRDAGREEGQG